MNKRTKALQFSKMTRQAIWDRDYGQCLFCNLDYHCTSTSQLAYEIKDIMHFVPRSQGGLGVEGNGVIGCRYHHQMLDNGNVGLRNEMLAMMEEHLKTHYPGWNREELVYSKWTMKNS